jgi:hypothetical protein
MGGAAAASAFLFLFLKNQTTAPATRATTIKVPKTPPIAPPFTFFLPTMGGAAVEFGCGVELGSAVTETRVTALAHATACKIHTRRMLRGATEHMLKLIWLAVSQL